MSQRKNTICTALIMLAFFALFFSSCADDIQPNDRADDHTPPKVLEYYPPNGALNFPSDSNLTLIFDEEIQPTGGMLYLYRAKDNTMIEEFHISSGNPDVGFTVVFGFNKLTINPRESLNTGTEYYVIIDSASIADWSINLNPFEGIISDDIWRFGTAGIDSTTADNYVTATISGAENLEFDASQMTIEYYKKPDQSKSTEKTIIGTMEISPTLKYSIVISFDDDSIPGGLNFELNNLGTTFTKKSGDMLDIFNFLQEGQVDLTINTDTAIVGTFSFTSGRNSLLENTVTVTNGRFSWKKPLKE